MLNPLEHLYYAIGELAYAMATADGKIQREESKRFLDMCVSELGDKKDEALVAEIIYKVLSREKVFSSDTAYDMAMQNIKTNSHYLSPELKNKAIRLLENVARAYPPFTEHEKELLSRFKKDVAPLEGDPLYYEEQ